MKELSIEEKAKAYDMAIERAKGAHNSAKSDKENGVTDKITEYTIQLTETIFPELRESERIRKEIVDFFKDAKQGLELQERDNNQWQIEQFKIFIAWLEKQGKKVEPIEGFNSEFERQISRLIASIINKEHEYTEAFIKWTSDAFLNYAKREIENQGEQKHQYKSRPRYVGETELLGGQNHTDKVEPKFHEGEWITIK